MIDEVRIVAKLDRPLAVFHGQLDAIAMRPYARPGADPDALEGPGRRRRTTADTPRTGRSPTSSTAARGVRPRLRGTGVTSSRGAPPRTPASSSGSGRSRGSSTTGSSPCSPDRALAIPGRGERRPRDDAVPRQGLLALQVGPPDAEGERAGPDSRSTSPAGFARVAPCRPASSRSGRRRVSAVGDLMSHALLANSARDAVRGRRGARLRRRRRDGEPRVRGPPDRRPPLSSSTRGRGRRSTSIPAPSTSSRAPARKPVLLHGDGLQPQPRLRNGWRPLDDRGAPARRHRLPRPERDRERTRGSMSILDANGIRLGIVSFTFGLNAHRPPPTGPGS